MGTPALSVPGSFEGRAADMGDYSRKTVVAASIFRCLLGGALRPIKDGGAFSTASILACIIVIPLFYEHMQRVRSLMLAEVEFCKVRRLWDRRWRCAEICQCSLAGREWGHLEGDGEGGGAAELWKSEAEQPRPWSGPLRRLADRPGRLRGRRRRLLHLPAGPARLPRVQGQRWAPGARRLRGAARPRRPRWQAPAPAPRRLQRLPEVPPGAYGATRPPRSKGSPRSLRVHSTFCFLFLAKPRAF